MLTCSPWPPSVYPVSSGLPACSFLPRREDSSSPLSGEIRGGLKSYQSLHGAVESMSVVSAELGVGALQGGVTRSLGLLDSVAGEV